MKQNDTVKKLALAGVLTAVAVVGSFISFPILGSKCAPVQHMVNILCAVTVGPWWALAQAFIASLIRNLLGLGSPLAFPGSMCGALLGGLLGLGSLMAFTGSMVGALCCGLVYAMCKKLWLTCCAEAFGTSVLGEIAAYPVAKLLMGLNPTGLFVYIVPFLVSTVVGSILAYVLISALEKGGALNQIRTER